jgi:hypothetical protein
MAVWVWSGVLGTTSLNADEKMRRTTTDEKEGGKKTCKAAASLLASTKGLCVAVDFLHRCQLRQSEVQVIGVTEKI